MALLALSSLDGRYAEATAPLREFFSEFAYLKTRLKIEVAYLAALGRAGISPSLSFSQEAFLSSFSEKDGAHLKELEHLTRHDVKAIEYFLRDRIKAAPESGLQETLPFLHFGLTSEDVNNISQSLALKDSRDQILLPVLDQLLISLGNFALHHRSTPMLARTHGQPAVPTTLGKEFALFVARLLECRKRMAFHQFEGKLTGAVGNFSALQAAVPEVDWIHFSRSFVESMGLTAALFTTQIMPADNWIRFFQEIQLLNSILIDLTRDVWLYNSDGYLKLAIVDKEIGSSTMPQKVNPIDFENAEGNAGIANALFSHYVQKLPVSRLQRDLSDSTVRRTFGVALGHTLLALQSTIKGMDRITADEERLRSDLNSHWEVVSEGAQTILRRAGRPDAYESLSALSRGRPLLQRDYLDWVDSLDVNKNTRRQLLALSPETYLGLAIELTDRILSEIPDIQTEHS